MKTKVKLIIMSVAISVFGALTPIASGSVSAIDPFRACSGSGGSSVCRGKNDSLMKVLGKIINTMLLLVGSIAVIAIIVNGIRFITADGDSQKVASARNGVVYSVVGIAVSIMAFAIVRFVVDRFG